MKHQFEVDSTTAALDLLMKTFLATNSSTDTLQEYYFKITSKFNEDIKESLFSYYMKNSRSILIEFKSSEDHSQSFIFWRTSNLDTFKCLNISEDPNHFVTNFCSDFLVIEMTNGRNGILKGFEYRREFDLKHIGNELRQNLLIIAASQCQLNVVKNIVAHDFDIDSIDFDGCNAIERAWEGLDKNGKSETDNIMETLLYANSKLPRDSFGVKTLSKVKSFKTVQFKERLAPRKVKNFIRMCENLHELTDSLELEEIEEILKNEPNLIYFYNKNNRSLMAHALLFNKIEVCKLLVSLKVAIAPHELDSLDKLYKTLEDDQKVELQLEHRVNAIELPKPHVYTLLMRSKIGKNDRQHDKRWAYVEKAFRIIDANETCSKILKIAAIFKKFTIYFDCKHEIVYYLDPKSNSGGLAKIYGVDTVYIGAKYLMDGIKKYGVFGAIIHELCHFAVFITYLNDYNPYPMGESEEKEGFAEAVEECISNRAAEEDIVGSVLSYPEYMQDSEFIVRVVQMLMHYCVQDPQLAEIHTKILAERKQKFRKLFKYFKDIVEKDFDDLLEIFERLLDHEELIAFDELTRPYKARILHSSINFQGQETNFNNLIGDDSEVLELMTPKQIRGMLVDGLHIPIAEMENEDFTSSERSFADYNTDLSRNIQEDIKSSEEIITEIQESKVFILADTAGAGKTTVFKDLSLKLKLIEIYKNYWVVLIELRKFQHIFEKFNKIHERDLTIEKIFEMLLEILNFDASKPQLEMKIFEKLFYSDRVILLFDAVDEISPYYNDFIISVLQKIQKTTHNQILVSTRPQHGKQLSKSLKAKPFKLVPFSWTEKESFILEMLKDSKNHDESKESDVLNEFNVFFKSIKKIGYFNYDIDNPLMVKIITELYIKGQVDLKNQSLDLYEIFEKIELSHKVQVDAKVAFVDRDPFSTISLEMVHQALALLLFSSLDKTDINQTYIIRYWNNNKQHLTADKIQRYGFVRIGLDFEKSQKFALDFTHRTYAEFFVAKFILTFMFNVEDYMKDKELENVINVIKSLVNSDIVDNIFGFIICYMKNELDGRKLVLKSRIRKLIVKEFNEMRKELFFDPHDEQLLYLRFFSIFFIREQNVLNDFWLLDKERNMMRVILIETHVLGFFKLQNIMETLAISYGVNWHETLNKSNQLLIKDEEINEIEGVQNFYIREFNRNLTKFLDYFEKNFTIDEKVTICKNNVFLYDYLEWISYDLMKKMITIHSDISINDKEILVDLLIEFIKSTNDKEFFLYLVENLEQILNNDAENIRKVLFCDFERDNHPIFKAVKFKSLEIFQKLRILFDTYKKPNDEMKNIFFIENNLLYLALLTPNKMFPEIIEFIRKIYGTDYKKFVQSFEARSNLKVMSLIFEDKKKFKSVKKMIMGFFNNEDKTKKVLKHLLTFGHLSFCAPLMPAIRKRNAKQFQKNLEIYKDYEISWDEVKDLNIVINISGEIFMNITKETYKTYKDFLIRLYESNKHHVEDPQFVHTFRCVGFAQTTKFYLNLSTNLIVKCIYHYKQELLWNEDKFNYFEMFLFEYFKDNEDQAREVIRAMLFCDEYLEIHFTHPFIKPIENGDSYEFNRIIKLYEKYKSSDDELRNIFKSTNIFCTMLFIMSNEIYNRFFKLIHNLFSEDKKQILECINHMVIYKAVGDDDKFIYLQRFIENFFENDEGLKSEFIRKIIFFNYSGEVYPLLKVLETHKIDHLKAVHSLYREHKISWEEIQNIIKKDSFLISLFNRVTEENYEIVTNFLQEIFEFDLNSLREVIQNNCLKYRNNELHNNMNKFKLFEKFVFEIFHDDQKLARSLIKRVWFGIDGNQQYHPIHSAIMNKNFNELEFSIEMYRNYSDNFVEIQENFIEYDILSILFQNYMSDEMSEIFKNFLLEIFGSNIENFKKFIKNDEILEMIKNEDKINLFEDLIFDYFRNNEILSCKLVNDILTKNCILDSLEISDDHQLDFIKKVENIYLKYKNSWTELFEKISELPDDLFDPLKEFMVDVFESNEELINNCFTKKYRQDVIRNAENFKSFMKFFKEYFTDKNVEINKLLDEISNNEKESISNNLEALKKEFLNSNIFLKIYSCLKCNDSTLSLLNDSLDVENLELLNCMNESFDQLEFSQEQSFRKIQKLLTALFIDEMEDIRICIRKGLLHN